MISLIEALNFRCLHHVRQPLDRFHVLVGANGSGKTTFLDVVGFLGDLVARGPEEAIRARTQNFEDLLWQRRGDSFELAIEARIPDGSRVPEQHDTIRYEVRLGKDEDRNEVGIWSESLFFKADSAPTAAPARDFPVVRDAPESIADAHAGRSILHKRRGNGDSFASEEVLDEQRWSLKLGPRRSALANLPEDESLFPAAAWLKAMLVDGVATIVLDSHAMRRASPPGQGRGFKPDGSNLPWVIDALQARSPERHRDWIAHLQTALPDLEGVRTVERSDDRHRYLMLQYRGGLEVPSWTASDGTLRLLALTLLAYIPDLGGVYLIEEPENGIHPRAVETMYQALSNVYDAQVLLATHSPLVLRLVEPSQLLCFAKASDGATDIVRGTEHPTLQDWKAETNLSTLFAAGILG